MSRRRFVAFVSCSGSDRTTVRALLAVCRFFRLHIVTFECLAKISLFPSLTTLPFTASTSLSAQPTKHSQPRSPSAQSTSQSAQSFRLVFLLVPHCTLPAAGCKTSAEPDPALESRCLLWLWRVARVAS